MSDTVPIPEQGLPDYNYETATETERWCYDQGFEAGWRERLDPATLTLGDLRELLPVLIAGLDRIIAEQS